MSLNLVNRKNNSSKKLISIAVLASIGLIACSSDDPETGDTEITYTADDVKLNYVAMANAAYTDSLETATALQTAVDTFIAAPTEDNLTAAKAAYKEARIPYQQSEIMRWDTAITSEQNLGDEGIESVDEWEGQVNAWPLDENHIVDIIAGVEDINIDLLLAQNGANDNEANVTTGVHAIEFMLWGEDANGTDAGAGERAAIEFDTTNCADALCDRRADYLKAASDLLVADLTAMQAEWDSTAQVTEGTLSYNFLVSDLSLDYILGSMHAMATDELAGARMNSGLTLGDPEEEHDCFSDLSHVAIYYNFQGVRNAFYGTYDTVVGAGVGDLIRQLDEETYNDIDDSLAEIETYMAEILALGEDETNPVKFDQIIGLASTESARITAETAVTKLIELDSKFKVAAELLSLNPIDTSGGGDGD